MAVQPKPAALDGGAPVHESTAEALPVGSLREAAPFLRRPFTPEATRFKVQAVFSGASGCLVVAYIDARLVIERLNKVIPDGWEARYEPVTGSKLMWCHLTVGGVTRSDVGESSKGMSKDLVSDSLKRAAVHFGVGVSVYALPQITLRAGTPHVEKRKSGQKDTLVLTEHGHEKLRDGYAKWLDEHGRAKFGEPLDHGDVEGQTFDPDEEADEFAPEPAAALDDDRAQALYAELDEAYSRVDKTAIPPARYRAWVVGAAHSHGELERLLAYLEQMAAAA